MKNIILVIAYLLVGGICFASSDIMEEKGTTGIPGTCSWNIDNDSIIFGEKSDLWWNHKSDKERFLIPMNGAKIQIVTDKKYEEIDLEYLKNFNYPRYHVTSDPLYGATFNVEGEISGSDSDNLLVPGTVLAICTSENNFAKLKVVKYHSLHDFNFKGAEAVRDSVILFSAREPDRDNYHIEFEWTLYKEKSNLTESTSEGNETMCKTHQWENWKCLEEKRKQDEAYKQLIEKNQRLLKKSEEQQKRFDNILSTWEAQQQQYQRYLDRLEE